MSAIHIPFERTFSRFIWQSWAQVELTPQVCCIDQMYRVKLSHARAIMSALT